MTMRARSIGEAIRREVLPVWDEATEARVLRRVSMRNDAPRRAMWPIVLVALAAVIVAMISMWRVSVATQDEAGAGTMAPMERAEPSERETSVHAKSDDTKGKVAAPERVDAMPTAEVDVVDLHATPPIEIDAPKGRREAATRPPDAASLLDQADAARRRGDLVEATSLLRKFIDAHPRHPEVVSVRMGLARVLEQRKRFAEAARAYEALLSADVIAPIREDARAGAARVWARAGRADLARVHAQTYLERSASGPHARAMEAIAKQ